MTRTRNEQLEALLREAGWSRAQAASAFNRAAHDIGLAGIGRSHISMWVGGTRPTGQAPLVLCQALSRRLSRVITPGELGLASPGPSAPDGPDWHAEPLTALADLGRADLDADRRGILASAVYSAAGAALPGEAWWRAMAQARPPETGPQRAGHADVAAVRELTACFSRIDQRRGGGRGRQALAQYLHGDVARLLHGSFRDETVRNEAFSAASEAAYLTGWMAFDNSEHATAQHYFVLALKLAAAAGDQPLSGHILRAMAHQAIDLGACKQGLDLAAASVDSQRYLSATPRERALLGVVHARALAANGMRKAAATALTRAEDDLASAGGVAEPDRTFFFGEASLAHETACTLRCLGDHDGAIGQFQHSVRMRGPAFTRTHAVTLGYLGAVQIAAGGVEEACSTWSAALDAMDQGIYSGRVRRAAADMRVLLSPYRHRKIPAATAIDQRARQFLSHQDSHLATAVRGT